MTGSDAAHNPLDAHRPHQPPEEDHEKIYYEGSPLIRGELGTVGIWFVLGLALIAAPFVWWFVQDEWPRWWVILIFVALGLLLFFLPYVIVKRISYRVTNYRIDYERGLLSKTIDTMELWHVDDIKFHQSLFGRMFGVGTIEVMSDDQTTPKLNLRSLPQPRPLFDTLKQRVISIKRQRGVIKMDMG